MECRKCLQFRLKYMELHVDVSLEYNSLNVQCSLSNFQTLDSTHTHTHTHTPHSAHTKPGIILLNDTPRVNICLRIPFANDGRAKGIHALLQ